MFFFIIVWFGVCIMGRIIGIDSKIGFFFICRSCEEREKKNFKNFYLVYNLIC